MNQRKSLWKKIGLEGKEQSKQKQKVYSQASSSVQKQMKLTSLEYNRKLIDSPSEPNLNFYFNPVKEDLPQSVEKFQLRTPFQLIQRQSNTKDGQSANKINKEAKADKLVKMRKSLINIRLEIDSLKKEKNELQKFISEIFTKQIKWQIKQLPKIFSIFQKSKMQNLQFQSQKQSILRQQIQKLEKMIILMKQENVELRQNINSLQNLVQEKERIISQQNQQILVLRSEINTKTGITNQIMDKINDLQQTQSLQISQLEQENEDLSNQMKILASHLMTASNQLQEFAIRFSQSESQLAQAAQSNSTLQKSYEQIQQSYKELEEEYLSSKEQNQKMKKSLIQISDSYLELETLYSMLKEKQKQKQMKKNEENEGKFGKLQFKSCLSKSKDSSFEYPNPNPTHQEYPSNIGRNNGRVNSRSHLYTAPIEEVQYEDRIRMNHQSGMHHNYLSPNEHLEHLMTSRPSSNVQPTIHKSPSIAMLSHQQNIYHLKVTRNNFLEVPCPARHIRKYSNTESKNSHVAPRLHDKKVMNTAKQHAIDNHFDTPSEYFPDYYHRDAYNFHHQRGLSEVMGMPEVKNVMRSIQQIGNQIKRIRKPK